MNRDCFMCNRPISNGDCDKTNHDCSICEYYNCEFCNNQRSELCETCKKTKKEESEDSL